MIILISIMNIGKRIKQIPIKRMRDSIWAETSKLVEDKPWFIIRHSISNTVTILVIDSRTLLRFYDIR